MTHLRRDIISDLRKHQSGKHYYEKWPQKFYNIKVTIMNRVCIAIPSEQLTLSTAYLQHFIHTVFLCEIYFGVLHKHSADVTMFDTPWGSKLSQLHGGAFLLLLISSVR